MTHYKHDAKSAYHSKMERMGLHKKHKDTSFSDTEPYDGVPQLDSVVPAGKLPVGKQRFKRGGKVAHMEGHKAKHHLGHKPRAHKMDGGGLTPEQLAAAARMRNNPMNQDVSTGGLRGPGRRPVMSPTATPAAPARPAPLPPRRPTMAEPPGDGMCWGGAAKKAVGGPMGNPAIKKKMVGAMLARKRKAGLPAPNNLPAAAGTAMPRPAVVPPPPMIGRKKGGSVERHPDVAEDKKLIKSMVKGTALKHRTHKDAGGPIVDKYAGYMLPLPPEFRGLETQRRSESTEDERENRRPSYNTNSFGSSGQVGDRSVSTDKNGGRIKRATGGSVKKGKETKVVINIGQPQPMPQDQGMGMNPLAALAAAAGPAGGPPAGGAPMMPPAGAGPGLGAMGAPQVPGMGSLAPPVPPMARKSGGRVNQGMPKYQEHDYGSGSGLGRLEKRKWPTYS